MEAWSFLDSLRSLNFWLLAEWYPSLAAASCLNFSRPRVSISVGYHLFSTALRRVGVGCSVWHVTRSQGGWGSGAAVLSVPAALWVCWLCWDVSSALSRARDYLQVYGGDVRSAYILRVSAQRSLASSSEFLEPLATPCHLNVWVMVTALRHRKEFFPWKQTKALFWSVNYDANWKNKQTWNYSPIIPWGTPGDHVWLFVV